MGGHRHAEGTPTRVAARTLRASSLRSSQPARLSASAPDKTGPHDARPLTEASSGGAGLAALRRPSSGAAPAAASRSVHAHVRRPPHAVSRPRGDAARLEQGAARLTFHRRMINAEFSSHRPDDEEALSSCAGKLQPPSPEDVLQITRRSAQVKGSTTPLHPRQVFPATTSPSRHLDRGGRRGRCLPDNALHSRQAGHLRRRGDGAAALPRLTRRETQSRELAPGVGRKRTAIVIKQAASRLTTPEKFLLEAGGRVRQNQRLAAAECLTTEILFSRSLDRHASEPRRAHISGIFAC